MFYNMTVIKSYKGQSCCWMFSWKLGWVWGIQISLLLKHLHFTVSHFFIDLYILLVFSQHIHMPLHINVKIQNCLSWHWLLYVSFYSQKWESSKSNNWQTQLKWHLLGLIPSPSKTLLQVLTSKARSSKHGLENSKETSSNLLVDKNIQSLKSEWES